MIDHLVYATPNLEATVKRLRDESRIDLVAGGAHVGRGTRNYLAGLGDGRYLEVIGPDLEQDSPREPRPFGVDDLETERLVTWCARPHDPLTTIAERARSCGYDIGEIAAMSRRRPDGLLLEWELTVRPGPPHALIPFCIAWGTTPHPSGSLTHTTTLDQLVFCDPNPASIITVLCALGEDLEVQSGPRAIEANLVTPTGPMTLC